MKTQGKKIFLIILLAFLLIFGIDFFLEYLGNHQYYTKIMSSRTNRKIIIFGLVALVFPISYILFNKKFKLKSFLLWVWIALCIFALSHSGIKFELVGIQGFFMTIVNTTLLFGLGMYTITSIYALGECLSTKLLKFSQFRFQELLINFGIGLALFLLINWIAMGLGIFYSIVVFAIFISGGVLLFLRKKQLATTEYWINKEFESFSFKKIKQEPRKIAVIVLIVLSLLYYFLGFQLSIIPYPTAWDANHEYIYTPKVIADYHGIIRGNQGPASVLPYLRHGFIAFFFALIKPISGWFWLTPDTIAVSMNFLSGIFVLFFGLGVISSINSFFSDNIDSGDIDDSSNNIETKKNNTTKKIIKRGGFVFGFTALLLWLYSGMGAFLVFVDNKTDLGVMALILLAIVEGLVAVQYITKYIETEETENKEKIKAIKKESLKYLVVSGIFFAFAAMGKPTAFIDIVVFGIFMIGWWLNSLISSGIGVIVIGFMGILQPLNAKDFIDPVLGKRLILIGGIMTLSGIVILGVNIFKKNIQKNKIVNYFKYIIVWGISFGITLVLCKTPGLIYKYHLSGELTLPNYTKGLLFAQNTTGGNINIDTNTNQNLERASINDKIAQKDIDLDYNQCEKIEFSEEELNRDLIKIQEGNEDIGRYVGYGREQFEKGDLGYALFKIFFWEDNTCYGLNTDAKLLCKNADAITQGNIKKLENIEALGKLTIGSKAEKLLQKTLNEYKTKPEMLKYNLEKLRQYYQDHSIYTQEDVINIPYRYIIPLNISFNWSLQNLTSYYTDIGFVWLIMLWIVVFSVIYGIIFRKKLLKNLALTTTIGRFIWILIAGGILRYGIGLIMRTIITNVVFFVTLGRSIQENKKSSEMIKYIGITVFGIVMTFFIVQQLMNIIRIASQGGGEPFIRYKQSTGKELIFTDTFEQKRKITVPYTAEKIYNLQFGFYNPIIEKVDQRNDDDGLFIAGTYMQYFLKKQKNIIFDTALGALAKLSSDENVCKTHKRLRSAKNNNIKYIVLDQNIGTVVMGEGNKSLFYRFFAKVNEKTKKIEQEGAISMLLKLKKYGYLDLLYTNNLGTKYAFTLPDSAFIEYFKVTDPQQIALLRAKISVIRFFLKEKKLVNFIIAMFEKRFSQYGLQDIADMLGKKITVNHLIIAVDAYLQKHPGFQQRIKTLTQEERIVMAQFISLYMLNQKKPEEYNNVLSSIISNSLFGSTQVASFEVK